MNSIKNNQNIGKYDRDNIYNIYKTNNDLKDITIYIYIYIYIYKLEVGLITL